MENNFSSEDALPQKDEEENQMNSNIGIDCKVLWRMEMQSLWKNYTTKGSHTGTC